MTVSESMDRGGKAWREREREREDVGHMRKHQRVRVEAEAVIARYREQVGLEAAWSIEVVVCCPADLSLVEASIWWDAEVWYARLYLRCDGNQAFRLWVVLHELCELQTWRTGSFVRGLVEQWPSGEESSSSLDRQQLMREWQRERNQEIEWRIFGLTGMRRPDHFASPRE